MKTFIKSAVSVSLLIIFSLSSFGSPAQSGVVSAGSVRIPEVLSAPTIVAARVALNGAEGTKYKQMAEQHRRVNQHRSAGASSTTKIVLLTVGGVVVVLGLLALAATHGGTSTLG